MKNRYPCYCVNCEKTVGPDHGCLIKVSGKYKVSCSSITYSKPYRYQHKLNSYARGRRYSGQGVRYATGSAAREMLDFFHGAMFQ